MLIRILFLVLAVMPIAAPSEASLFDKIKNIFKSPAPPTPPMIRALIVHDKPGVVLEVKGKYRLFDPHTMKHISTRFTGKRKFVQPLEDGLKWGEEFPGIHQILIVPDDLSVTTIVDGIEYRGSVYIYDIGGAISVVNETYVEDYLDSVLSLQFRESLPEEALAAVAIAARTNAYFCLEHPRNKFWDVDAAQVGYHGFAVTHQSSGIEQAVHATRYMIMTRTSDETGERIPFPAIWNPAQSNSRITTAQATGMALQGDHAAQILAQAYPGAKIVLFHYSQPSSFSK